MIIQGLEKFQLSLNKMINASVVHTQSRFGEFKVADKGRVVGFNERLLLNKSWISGGLWL